MAPLRRSFNKAEMFLPDTEVDEIDVLFKASCAFRRKAQQTAKTVKPNTAGMPKAWLEFALRNVIKST